MIKAIIVEDDNDLRVSLVGFLRLEGIDACGVESCLGFYQSMAISSFSIAVIDAGLPDQNAYLLAEYMRRNTDMGIVMLSARDVVEDRVRGYDSGADIYLVKPIDCRELAAVIKSLASRRGNRIPLPAPSAATMPWRLIRESWQLFSPDGKPVLLTAREMQFLLCLADASGQPVSRDFLLQTLGYRDDEYAKRAMDSMVRRVRRKIRELAGQEPPIKTIHSIGYCFSTSIMIS